jgi:hypothetical protein
VWERLRHRWAAIQSTVAPRLIAHALAPDIRQAVGGYLKPIGLHHLSYLVKLPGPPVLIDRAQGGSRRIAWSKRSSRLRTISRSATSAHSRTARTASKNESVWTDPLRSCIATPEDATRYAPARYPADCQLR